MFKVLKSMAVGIILTFFSYLMVYGIIRWFDVVPAGTYSAFVSGVVAAALGQWLHILIRRKR
jgi:hypothetical protein